MRSIDVNSVLINPFKSVGTDWMVITAGDKNGFNMMTASWGQMGALWGNSLNGRPTVEIFVRPCRYTDHYIDENDCFSLCFFDEKFRDDLLYLGSHSGKNENKLSHTKLTINFMDDIPYYNEAKLVLFCRKIYKGKITKDGFIDKSILDKFYKQGDDNIYNNSSFHNVYIGEVIKIIGE